MTDEVGYLYVWRNGDTIHAVRVCGTMLSTGGRCLRPYDHSPPHTDQKGQDEWDTPPTTPS